jgi:hypothetical protein
VITPNFFVIPTLVAKTERVALVQESFARRVVASMDTVRMYSLVLTPGEESGLATMA